MPLWQKTGLRDGDTSKLGTLLPAMKLPGCHVSMQGHLDTSKFGHALHIPSFRALQRLPVAASLSFTSQATEAQGKDVTHRGPAVAVKGGLRH